MSKGISISGWPLFHSFGTGATWDNLGSVYVSECDGLVEMHGFGPSPELAYITIDECDGLLSLAGLQLPGTMYGITVLNGEELQTLEGLGGVEIIENRITVSTNPALTSLDGLSGLRSAENIQMVGNINLGNSTVLEFVNALEYWGSLQVGGNELGDKSVVTLRP